MVLSTRDIKAIDPVTGDTVWDEPKASIVIEEAMRGLSSYDAIDFLRSLSLEIEKRAADLRDQIQRTDR